MTRHVLNEASSVRERRRAHSIARIGPSFGDWPPLPIEIKAILERKFIRARFTNDDFLGQSPGDDKTLASLRDSATGGIQYLCGDVIAESFQCGDPDVE